MLNVQNRTVYGPDHEAFRDTVRRFFERELVPHLDHWEEVGIIDRAFWTKAGEAGLLCPTVPEAYGGLGLDYTYNAVINEELCYAGSSAGISLQSDITAEYLVAYGTERQKHKWLPGMVSGEVVTAIAMTEPGAGSDLQGVVTTAVRDGDNYVINGSKTYITNGQTADMVIVVARTAPEGGSKGTSLIIVEADQPGFERGRNLDKIGQKASDTSELFFNDLRTPVENLLGEENRGFVQLMQQLPQERLSIAVQTQAGAQRAFDEALAFVKARKAFGKTVFDLQNTRFVLADLQTRLQVGWSHLDWCLARHRDGELTAVEAASAKLWHSELLWDACDAALQLHGGAGYMNEYPIARLWRDARVSRIYGGTSEVMKEVISRSL
ncbi:acyl-CoA dehydrogenase family protein [soil metagenome]